MISHSNESSLNGFCLPHLVITAAAAGTAGAALGTVLVPVALTAGLGVIGFGAAGPVAGKIPSQHHS